MKLSANETKVYELLKKDNSINIEQIVATSKISRRTVIRILNNLKDYDIIKRVGSDKTGHWEIIN
ncbi:MAG: winged helix-turn-helix transcriptional regulator [Lachnospiraceae bacterium]|nr:winged helix-turn-helix transcriptional regulator [Lachnospiraceae bacterium]